MNRTIAVLAIPLIFMSGAAAAKVSAVQVERVSPDKVVVTWAGKAPVDVYVSNSAESTLATAKLVSRADGDESFESATSPGARHGSPN